MHHALICMQYQPPPPPSTSKLRVMRWTGRTEIGGPPVSAGPRFSPPLLKRDTSPSRGTKSRHISPSQLSGLPVRIKHHDHWHSPRHRLPASRLGPGLVLCLMYSAIWCCETSESGDRKAAQRLNAWSLAARAAASP